MNPKYYRWYFIIIILFFFISPILWIFFLIFIVYFINYFLDKEKKEKFRKKYPEIMNFLEFLDIIQKNDKIISKNQYEIKNPEWLEKEYSQENENIKEKNNLEKIFQKNENLDFLKQKEEKKLEFKVEKDKKINQIQKKFNEKRYSIFDDYESVLDIMKK